MILGDSALGSAALGDLPIRSAAASAHGEAIVGAATSIISSVQAIAEGEAVVGASASVLATVAAIAQGEASTGAVAFAIARVTIDAGIPGLSGSGITDRRGAAGAIELVSAAEPSEMLSDDAQALLTDESDSGPVYHIEVRSSVRAFSARLCARIDDTITHGGQIVEGSPDVRANGREVARVGDKVACRMHGDQTIEQGAPRVRANGRKVARIGDRVSCGALIDSGSQNVRVGGKA